jgi:hypothetical protein
LWPRLMNKASVVYDHVVMKCQMAVQN